MVSEDSTSRVMVLPVTARELIPDERCLFGVQVRLRVFTKIYSECVS
jgi:hypothetical protein